MKKSRNTDLKDPYFPYLSKKRQQKATQEANFGLLEGCENGSLEVVKKAIEDGAEINIEYMVIVTF